MQLSELLDRIRSHFVERLMEAIEQQRSDDEVTIVHEPALRDGKGKIVSAGSLDTPSRIDIVKVKDGEVIDSLNVDTEDMLSFEPFEFTWPTNELEVAVEPFQWNWLQVQTTADPSGDDWRVLNEWFMKWFGENDPAMDQLAGAVHFMDDPAIDGSSIQLTIDMGTSPVEALEELLDALGTFGANEARIGQFPDSASD